MDYLLCCRSMCTNGVIVQIKISKLMSNQAIESSASQKSTTSQWQDDDNRDVGVVGYLWPGAIRGNDAYKRLSVS